MLHSSNGKAALSQGRLFLTTQRSNWCSGEVGYSLWFSSGPGELDVSSWKKISSRILGVSSSKISHGSLNIIRVLQYAGYEAYFVGGCVRDLVLQRVPKDFDIITTAGLKQIKRMFKHAIIVGQRFPICRVYSRGSFVEVSSFDTSSQNRTRDQFSFPPKPKGCDPGDFFRWKNCMKRDFTVNSLFFDPSRNVIFDYTNALKDLRSMELRTIMPAHLSFKEDEARILRGLRLAARLNMSFSKEAEEAINSLSSSVGNLSKARIGLEMNYMLSYGAAEPSILLLEKFKLLQIFLPFQAAYLSYQRGNGSDLRSTMLMKLFSKMDQLVSCSQPANQSFWVAILAFHTALFSNPCHPMVILTFASLLYHGTWGESINFARKHSLNTEMYVPEILEASGDLSDECIADEVSQLARHVEESLNVLVNTDKLSHAMTRFPKFSCPDFVFVSQKKAQQARHIILAEDVLSSKNYSRSVQIDSKLLSEGDIGESRFALGKIILETLVGRTVSTNPEGEEPSHVQVISLLKTLDSERQCKRICFVDDDGTKENHEQRQSGDALVKRQRMIKTSSSAFHEDSYQQRESNPSLSRNRKANTRESLLDDTNKDAPLNKCSTAKLSTLFR